MAVNKVVYDSKTLIDISDSTVTPEVLLKGYVAYNAKGERIVGTMPPELLLDGTYTLSGSRISDL